jgi:type II secretory pathway component PulF
MAAKHEIKNWYTKEKLDKFIKAINTGKTFEKAFSQ